MEKNLELLRTIIEFLEKNACGGQKNLHSNSHSIKIITKSQLVAQSI